MVLPVMLAASAAPSDDPAPSDDCCHRQRSNVYYNNYRYLHSHDEADGRRSNTIFTRTTSSHNDDVVGSRKEHVNIHQLPRRAGVQSEEHHSTTPHLFTSMWGMLTVSLLLVSVLLAAHPQGAEALSCAPCELKNCVNRTDCPGDTVLDVCGCCHVCARVLNQSCGGPWGIHGKCSRNLHCFVQRSNSPIQEMGVCKEIKEVPQESLCPGDSFLFYRDPDTADNIADGNSIRRLPHPPPPPPLMPLSSSPTHAGSGNGKDDFSNTNTYTSGDDDNDGDDDEDYNANSNEINSLNIYDLDNSVPNDEEDRDEFLKTNNNEASERYVGDDSVPHENIDDNSFNNEPRDVEYLEFLEAELPTSFCTCNMSTCQVPSCGEGHTPRLVHNGTGIPGECCDVYECDIIDKCFTQICPVVDEEPCPVDSVRPPPIWTDDMCCKTQRKCTCRPKEECEPVACPPGFQVQVISRASWQPGSCCDRFRCVNESGLTCHYEGKELKNGQTWTTGCKKCECRDGLNRCKDKTCKKPSCTWMVIPEGECCPVCRGCVSYSGVLYNNSDVWRENNCTTCSCKDGQAQCQAEMCETKCSNPKHVPGQCCPECPDGEDNVSVARLCPGLDSCDLSCSHGLEQADNGCFLCQCKPEPCDLDCPQGFQSDIEGRPICQCREVSDLTRPPPCPKRPECGKKCEYGFQRTTEGCFKCKCNKCDHSSCTKTCLHGYIINDEGCQLCKCKDAPSPNLTYPPMSVTENDGKPCMSRAGALHDDGESWNDGCRVCYCHNGVEMCSLIACPAPHCSNPVFRNGDCCPTCPGLTVITSQGDKVLCQSSSGRYYVEGETWDMDQCTKCVCHGGTILCQTPACPPVVCHHPVRPEGSCCSSCRGENLSQLTAPGFPRHCKSSTGMFYKHREVWQPTPCQSCTCQNGQIQCYNQMCPPVNCNRTILKKGQCCPICVEPRHPTTCIYNGDTYESGEQWKGDNCTQCICVKGKFKCFPLSCPSLHCSVLVVRRGQCCPECYDTSLLKSEDVNDKEEKPTNYTVDSPLSSYPGEESSKASGIDTNIVGFSILGILVFLLAIAVLVLVFILLRRRQHQLRSPRFRPRPKSTNLELQGHMPFIPPDSVSGGGGGVGGGVDTADKDLHSSKSVNVEKQLLEKLCSGLVNERETRATNPYTEMVFGDQGKDSSRASGHFLASVKT